VLTPASDGAKAEAAARRTPLIDALLEHVSASNPHDKHQYHLGLRNV